MNSPRPTVCVDLIGNNQTNDPKISKGHRVNVDLALPKCFDKAKEPNRIQWYLIEHQSIERRSTKTKQRKDKTRIQN